MQQLLYLFYHNVLLNKDFLHTILRKSSNVSSKYVLRFTHIDTFSIELHKFQKMFRFVPYHSYSKMGTPGKFNAYRKAIGIFN